MQKCGILSHLPSFDELCDVVDDELFCKVVRLLNHVLHALLPLASIASHPFTAVARTSHTIVRLKLSHTHFIQRHILCLVIVNGLLV
jgi:hypothetical protein